MIRYLADADLNHAIVKGCRRREPAMDFLSANEAGLEGISDSAVLARAAQQGRILVSHDYKTMPRYFAEFVARGGCSAGVFLVSQHLPIRVAIEELVVIWAASEPGEWRDRLVRIPE